MSRPTMPSCREIFISIAAPPRITAKRSATPRRRSDLTRVTRSPTAMLSRAAMNLATNYAGSIATKEQQEAIAKARASAKSALDLDPNLADAHSAQGKILVNIDFNFAKAEAEYRRALELAPQNSAVAVDLAQLISDFGWQYEAV